MAASRLMILGVAVAAAGGAGYVAKNMSAPPAAQVVATEPQQPQIELTDVLVLIADQGHDRDVRGLGLDAEKRGRAPAVRQIEIEQDRVEPADLEPCQAVCQAFDYLEPVGSAMD